MILCWLLVSGVWAEPLVGSPLHPVVLLDDGAPLPATKRVIEAARWHVVVVVGTEESGKTATMAWDGLRKQSGFDPRETSVVAIRRGHRDATAIAAQRWEEELGLSDAQLSLLLQEATNVETSGDVTDAVGAAVVRALDDAITLGRIENEQAEMNTINRQRLITSALGTGFLAAGIVALLVRRRDTREKADTAERGLAAFSDLVHVARREVADLPTIPDGEPPAGPRTHALFEEARRSLLSLSADLEQMTERLSAADASTALINPIDEFKHWYPGWPARLAATRLALVRAQDALAASGRRAEDDLPIETIDEFRRRFAVVHIPFRWVEDHPLATQPATAWAALNALRIADPAAYLEALRAALFSEERALDRGMILLSEVLRVDAAQATGAAQDGGVALSRFRAAVESSERLDEVRDLADAAVDVHEAEVARSAAASAARAQIVRQRRAAREAVSGVSAAIRSNADRRVGGPLLGRLAALEMMAAEEALDAEVAVERYVSIVTESKRLLRELSERRSLVEEWSGDGVVARARLARLRTTYQVRLGRIGSDNRCLLSGTACLDADPTVDGGLAAMFLWETATRAEEAAADAAEGGSRRTRASAERAESAAERRRRDQNLARLGPTYPSLALGGGRRASRSPD